MRITEEQVEAAESRAGAAEAERDAAARELERPRRYGLADAYRALRGSK
ncbi:hypothetical protein ACFWJ5_02500 [Streptomyces qaidamensis]